MPVKGLVLVAVLFQLAIHKAEGQSICQAGKYTKLIFGMKMCTDCAAGKHKALLMPSFDASQGPVPTRAITIYIPQGVRDEGGIKGESVLLASEDHLPRLRPKGTKAYECH